jgi:outer membrane protein assembly factor BamB
MTSLLTTTVLVIAAAPPADWPRFRGPTGDGISRESGLPVTWSETENIAWKTLIPGLGRSSPVVLGDRVWVTTAVRFPEGGAADPASRGKGDGPGSRKGMFSLAALCFDRSDGRLIYRTDLFTIEDPGAVHDLNSHATPTPTVEPGRLYCDFGAYGTAALDAGTGRVLWRERLAVDHQLGPGSSPVVSGNRLILVRDGLDAQYVAALDTSTGRLAWKTARPPIVADGPAYKKSFSTPVVVEAAGRLQAIASGAHWIVSYDPASGAEIWRFRHGKGYSIAPSPVCGLGMVFFTTGDYVADLLAVRIDGSGDVSATHLAWKASGGIPLMASPILVGEELYIVSDVGVASCLDARTGSPVWKERIGGNHAASPVLADGRLYFFDREGTAVVLRPGRKFERIAENRLGGTVIASPAVAGGAIFLRTDAHLSCIARRP